MNEEKEPPEYVTIEELERRGQVIYYPGPPGNIIKNIECPNCDACFTCASDYGEHKKAGCTSKNRLKGKLTPRDLDMLPWKAFRTGEGEWIFSNRAPYLLEAIRNGHTTFGAYRYWLYEDDRFIARRKIGGSNY